MYSTSDTGVGRYTIAENALMHDVARVTVLADNSVQDFGSLAEHGLAFCLEMCGRRLLFDTGQGLVLSHNAGWLGVPLEHVEAIVLSHGHFDHSGGLPWVLRRAPNVKMYLHPAAVQPKFARLDDGTSRDIGMPPPAKSALSALSEHHDTVTWTSHPTEVFDGVFVTGEIPRRTDYEDTGGPFYCDGECQQADALPDDQAIFFESKLGTVVLLGCSHAGVINTLQHIHELTDGRAIHTVIGGMHLVRASRSRMDQTIEELRRLGVQRIGPAHCTGAAATAVLWNAFPESCFPCGAGLRMEFEIPSVE